MTTLKVREGLWIPRHLVNKRMLQRNFEKYSYNDPRQCKKCSNFEFRHNAVCDECPNFGYHAKVWKQVTRDDKPYIVLPLGRKDLIPPLLKTSNPKLVDERVTPPMHYKRVKITQTLFDYQEGAVEAMPFFTVGTLKAPARTGKTVIAIALAIKLGVRTLILAHQIDLLRQFYATIYGDSERGDLAFTNAEIVEKEGRPFAIIATKPEHFLQADIVLATYQSLSGKTKIQELASLKDKFGAIMIDESHKAAAPHFSRVIQSFNSKYKYGFTATPQRKDGKHFVSERVLGKVVHSVKRATLTPHVQVILTGTSHNPRLDWTRALRQLERNDERNALLVKWAIRDIKAGKSLIIPLVYRSHIESFAQDLIRALKKVKRRPIEKQGYLADVDNVKHIVAAFHGGLKPHDRASVIERAKTGQIRCVVAMRSLVQLGINIPAWDTLYVAMPIANNPNFYQETSRIRTARKGKDYCMVRHFVDNTKLSVACFRKVSKTYKDEKMIMDNPEVFKSVVSGISMKEDFSRSTKQKKGPKEKKPYSGFRWNR